MLQDAIQKDNIDRSQHVKGPLTWSEFVRVGDKGSYVPRSDLGPLPVPQIQGEDQKLLIKVSEGRIVYLN